jgi:phosphatidylserine/phosphatidylglycerophosphate/cardiolipin synthase-like enzyme
MRRNALIAASVGLAVALGLGVGGCKGTSIDLGTSGGPGGGASAGVPGKGGGPTTASSGALTVLAEPGAGVGLIDKLITSARKSVDLTIYTLRDTVAEGDLVADAKRGVNVRVLLDQHLEKKVNAKTYSYLRSNGVHVAWAPPAMTYHQKTLTIDDTTSVVMTLNLVTDDYATTRDFAVIDTDPADVSAIVTTFNADFAGHGKGFVPPQGADLVWSPTNSQAVLLSVINGAAKSLAIENEEMAYPKVISALIAAAHRGVSITVTMTDQKTWHAAWRSLAKAGVHVRTLRDSKKVLYIHAKAIVADAGLPGQQVFLGSENFSMSSLRRNRELGIRTSAAPVIAAVNAALARDFAIATPFPA